MQFKFYPQNRKRKGNCTRKRNAFYVRNKDTLHKIAPKRNKAQTKGQPKYVQLVKQKMRNLRKIAQQCSYVC
jgi:hypothetical protein